MGEHGMIRTFASDNPATVEASRLYAAYMNPNATFQATIPPKAVSASPVLLPQSI